MISLRSWALTAIAASALLPALVSAQTHTDCDPTKVDCPADAALGIDYTWNMTNMTLDTSQNVWNLTGPGVSYEPDQAVFSMKQKGDAPTIKTNFYIFWGSVSVVMKAAPGQGIVSAVTLLSDDLDEIDWEWIGNDNTQVQTNYFGKDNTTTTDRAANITVTDPQGTWHNYTTAWDAQQIQWIVDGVTMRTLTYAQSDGNGTYYPQTPMQLYLGNWPGGDAPSPGTVAWAGGVIDWSKAPFNMLVASVTVRDGTQNATTYEYSDKTGDFKSIKVTNGQSSFAATLQQAPAESITDKWNSLSNTAKIAIYASVGGVVLILTSLCCFCCIRQRRAGRRERAAADADWDRSNSELLAYRNQMARGEFGRGSSMVLGGGGGGSGSMRGANKGGLQVHVDGPYGERGIPLSPNPQYAAQTKF